MLLTLHDARAKLEAEGLHVSGNVPNGLFIAATLRDAADGIRLSNDACSLMWNSSRWVAIFPREGLVNYEVPGSLAELVPLITAVYANYRETGGPLKDAFKRVVPEAEQFLSCTC